MPVRMMTLLSTMMDSDTKIQAARSGNMKMNIPEFKEKRRGKSNRL
jgi:hypothetical protein